MSDALHACGDASRIGCGHDRQREWALRCARVQDVVGRRHAIQALARDVVVNLRASEWR